mgnify:CR=1 FL=1
MSFEKVTYKSGETVITADNLNAIQDELIRVGKLLPSGGISAKDDGSGNIELTTSGGVSATDDGDGNITIGG